ncbi:MAG: hypothetical protein ACP5II_01270 [Infirmifilum sp.]|uniref:Uncharacterized protein n=1 Tax=Infirmifilum uzonense TaxID=1550241 RepID=A0A0F7FGJ5_9CREN|nr:hypothetical protein [Infirmifilum uzonense]AKG38192.1 hypothetical protein MA03_01280 [Infirmifilum uzonense]
MVYEQRSAKGLAIEGITALVILAALLFLFSTSFWISIPPNSKFQVGDIVVVLLTVLYIQRSEQLIPPLSAVASLALHVDVKKTSGIFYGFLRFLSIVVAYFSLRRTSLSFLTVFLDQNNSQILYDAFFTTLILLHVYSTVKRLVH